METEILLEIKKSPEGKQRTEFILWTEHRRTGTIDSCRRGEIVTDRLDQKFRTQLSTLAGEVMRRNSEREGIRIADIFGISDEEYIKKLRKAESEDAIRARERTQEDIDTGEIKIR